MHYDPLFAAHAGTVEDEPGEARAGAAPGKRALTDRLVSARAMRAPDPDAAPVPAPRKGGKGEPIQWSEDLALEKEFRDVLEYDADLNAEEEAWVEAIQEKLFRPINERRNRQLDDSYETEMAKLSALVDGVPDQEQAALFAKPSYPAFHRKDNVSTDWRQSHGWKQPVGDLKRHGMVKPGTYGANGPPDAIWGPAGGNQDPFAMDAEIAGFLRFVDAKRSTVSMPQLGLAGKPALDRRKVFLENVDVVKPGRVKKFKRGARGKKVGAWSIFGGRHMLSRGSRPEVMGEGPVFGVLQPGKPIHWYLTELAYDPDKDGSTPAGVKGTQEDAPVTEVDGAEASKEDSSAPDGDEGEHDVAPVTGVDGAESSKEDSNALDGDEGEHDVAPVTEVDGAEASKKDEDKPAPKSKRTQQDETMLKKAEQVLAEKRRSLEALREYYARRKKFIAKYKDQLE